MAPDLPVAVESQEGSKTLLAIKYSRGSLELLDQRKLPHDSIYIKILDTRLAWEAIRDMVVRGAPAIAIAAALALAVEVVNRPPPGSASDAVKFIQERLDYLVSSRPTAVNLADAATKLKQVAAAAAASSTSSEAIILAYVQAAEAMLAADVAANRAIGKFGAAAILARLSSKRTGGLRVLTHCNTGSLATAAYGTALGVIRALFEQGKLEKAICTETRPYNQGSRLTAFELVHDGIPATLIADSAAAYLQAGGGVDAIVVGADRIAANGDTANKIGTYSLALSAFHHGIPFYVAAPLTSTDVNIRTGGEIVIEERTPLELTHALGGAGPRVAPHGIHVWNPAFDVTPARLITGIITDKGLIEQKPGSDFDIPAFIASTTSTKIPASSSTSGSNATPTLAPAQQDGDKQISGLPEQASGFRPLDETSIGTYLEGVPVLVARLGGSSADWRVREIGDGNINFVYLVEGPTGSLVLKQALPYIRCVGESWPMTLDRAYFETCALREHRRFAPTLVPEVFHFDRTMAVTAMEYLKPPHIIVRKGLIAGQVYPLLARHMASYMASTLFHTSLLALSSETHKAEVAKFCGNVELCQLTTQVIFTEPYYESPNNRWTPSSQLDAAALALRDDDDLKLAVAELKAKFCQKTEALLHGDLHTGSLMATEASTKVIDPEFAYYGPIGFDIGAFLGNLLLSYFSQDGHATSAEPRQEFKTWILDTAATTWNLFTEEFGALWSASWEGGSSRDLYPPPVFTSKGLLQKAQAAFFQNLLAESLGFAGAKMIRRLVGIAHVEDFESIKDVETRARFELKALEFGKRLVKESSSFESIEDVVKAAARAS